MIKDVSLLYVVECRDSNSRTRTCSWMIKQVAGWTERLRCGVVDVCDVVDRVMMMAVQTDRMAARSDCIKPNT